MKYETPLTAQSACEVWSRVCAQSVVTEEQYNVMEDSTQEKGTEIDLSENMFNHDWNEAE